MVQVRNINVELGWSQVKLDQDWEKAQQELLRYIDSIDRRFTDLYNWIESLTVPEYTTTQRDALASPQNGQMIYNSTTNRIEIRQAGGWKYLTVTGV